MAGCQHKRKTIVYGTVDIDGEAQVYLTVQCATCGIELVREEIPDSAFDAWLEAGNVNQFPAIDTDALDRAWDKHFYRFKF